MWFAAAVVHLLQVQFLCIQRCSSAILGFNDLSYCCYPNSSNQSGHSPLTAGVNVAHLRASHIFLEITEWENLSRFAISEIFRHQQPWHIQNLLNRLSASSCFIWTSAGHLSHVFMPKYIEMLSWTKLAWKTHKFYIFNFIKNLQHFWIHRIQSLTVGNFINYSYLLFRLSQDLMENHDLLFFLRCQTRSRIFSFGWHSATNA